MDKSYSASKEEIEVRVRFSTTKEDHLCQTKISKTDKDGFSRAVFRSRLELKAPVADHESLVCYVRVLLSVAKSLLRMGISKQVKNLEKATKLLCL